MQILTLKHGRTIQGVWFAPGAPMVVAERIAHYLVNHPEHSQNIAALVPFDEATYKPYDGSDLTRKSVLLHRSGVYGDILLLTPVAKALQSRYHRVTVGFATEPRMTPLLARAGFPLALHQFPTPLEIAQRYDYHVGFEGIMDIDRDPTHHAVDTFAARAHVKIGKASERIPLFNLERRERQKARHWLRDVMRLYGDRKHRPWLAIQVKASNPVRSYPEDNLIEVVKMASAARWRILTFGMQESDLPRAAYLPGVVNLCGRFPNIVDAVAVLAECDALLAPDSSFTHFAAALKLPTVAVYGPYPGAIRTRDYPNCVTLEPKGFPCPNYPCMQISQGACLYALGLFAKHPEFEREGFARRYGSPCLRDITAVQVMIELKKIMDARPERDPRGKGR